MDIDEWLGDVAPELAMLELDRWHAFSTRELPTPAWKVAFDGYLESYHFASLHRTTIFTQNGDVFAPAILTTPPSPTPYSSTTTAYDTCHNVKTDYSGATVDENNTLLEASFEPSGGQTLSWASGIGTLKISATISETDNTITVEDETTGISDTSNPFVPPPGVTSPR